MWRVRGVRQAAAGLAALAAGGKSNQPRIAPECNYGVAASNYRHVKSRRRERILVPIGG
jgi:hypothetical protein